MKKTCRIFALFLALMMLITIMSGCGDTSDPSGTGNNGSASKPAAESSGVSGDTPAPETENTLFPLFEEPTEFSIWTAGYSTSADNKMEDNLVYNKLAEMTNVVFKWQLAMGDDIAAQFGIMVASNDLPNIISRFDAYWTSSLDDAIDQELIIDLAEIVPEYAPDYNAALQDPSVGKLTYTDGGALPGFVVIKTEEQLPFVGALVRQDWLDELEIPAPVTIADWKNMLTAFGTSYDSVNMGGLLFNNTGFFDRFGEDYTLTAAYEVGTTTNPIINKNGTAVYTLATENYKDYLKEMSSWYAEGLIYHDFNSVSPFDDDMLTSLITTGKVGVYESFSTDVDLIESMGEAEGFRLMGIEHPVLEAGQDLHLRISTPMISTGRLVVITPTCEYPEKIAQFYNYLYTEEGTVLKNYGIEGVTYTVDGDGSMHYTDFMVNNEDGLSFDTMRGDYLAMLTAGYYDLGAEQSTFSEHVLECQEAWLGTDNDASYVMPSAVVLTMDEQNEYSDLNADINTYVSEYILKIISGDEDLESSWDNYISTLESMNYTRLEELYQAALDRYNS